MRKSRGFSLIELLVVIGIIGVLLAILLPMAERVRHKGYIDQCAANLRSIGQALQIYSNDNHGAYPRTVYTPNSPWTLGTGAACTDPFHGTNPPAPNDITAAAFLLLRAVKSPSTIFICPYNDVFVYEADHADPQSQSNFTDQKKNLGYSFANPYPNDAATNTGYKWTNRLGAEFAVASDKNPGNTPPKNDVVHVTVHSASRDMEEANSGNHEKEGQNVLYADGHVSWVLNPFAGVAQDNIFTNRTGKLDTDSFPIDKDDSVLLPTSD